MSVYVDDVRIPWRGKYWSHLTADTEAELHDFAAKIGLRRDWFQPSSTRPEAHHYDVTDSKRDEAILAGAIPESWRDGAARRREIGRGRAAGVSPQPKDSEQDPGVARARGAQAPLTIPTEEGK